MQVNRVLRRCSDDLDLGVFVGYDHGIMSAPRFYEFMLPVLHVLGNGGEWNRKDIVDATAAHMNLSGEDLTEMLPSGARTRVVDRVNWACTYLKQAGLLATPRRGVLSITDEGRAVLQNPPQEITKAFLSKYPSFRQFSVGTDSNLSVVGDGGSHGVDSQLEDTTTPEERIGSSIAALRTVTEGELLERVHAMDPYAFERLVIGLLGRMGYGSGGVEKLNGGSGDGGIDGIIHEDRLGLDKIYVQAKRYQGSVSPAEVRDFLGSLTGHGVKKGVLITSGTFTQQARETVVQNRSDSKVVLIDGTTLARHMFDFNVGVQTAATYETKRIDLDFFDEDGV